MFRFHHVGNRPVLSRLGVVCDIETARKSQAAQHLHHSSGQFLTGGHPETATFLQHLILDNPHPGGRCVTYRETPADGERVAHVRASQSGDTPAKPPAGTPDLSVYIPGDGIPGGKILRCVTPFPNQGDTLVQRQVLPGGEKRAAQVISSCGQHRARQGSASGQPHRQKAESYCASHISPSSPSVLTSDYCQISPRIF